ncbi:hypothetical protein [Caballeronia grimmiae]|uniref:Uncharacterized protein n=1 Tax=Caballeronia grimmiae TaxID=1071679 RepID=A0A069NNH1_9BURK|nr:hypothetical protein [Caballeronia grimmiae]KDR26591.1 hypothetical protein BG57_26070 [Caballeronia grimmiae]GGD96928.1 hypothetical protein GCM10010985_59560 [Caballeronia grimmiae]
MTDAARKSHPFLDDLEENVVLISSVLRCPVHGRETVARVVKAGACHYASQTPRFLGAAGERSYFEYDAQLVDGVAASGLVSMVRNAHGRVTHLHIAFSPLDAVLSMANGLREQLGAECDPAWFLPSGEGV